MAMQSTKNVPPQQASASGGTNRIHHIRATCRNRRTPNRRQGMPMAVSATSQQHQQLLYQIMEDVPQAVQDARPKPQESLLQALIERAEVEAQRSSSGSDYVDTSASDAILDRIPGKEELTSLVAGILNGSEAAVSGLQGLLQGGGDGGSGDNFQKLLGSVANGLSTEQLEQISATTWQARKTLQGVVTAPRDFLQGAVSGQSTEGLAPNELFGSLEAATASVQAQLDRTIQAVGAAIQVPGAAGPSVEVVQLLESRRAAGHLLDLTPLYKAWATLLEPLEVFGDRWLLNILFLAVFALLGFTLIAKTPRN